MCVYMRAASVLRGSMGVAGALGAGAAGMPVALAIVLLRMLDAEKDRGDDSMVLREQRGVGWTVRSGSGTWPWLLLSCCCWCQSFGIAVRAGVDL